MAGQICKKRFRERAGRPNAPADVSGQAFSGRWSIPAKFYTPKVTCPETFFDRGRFQRAWDPHGKHIFFSKYYKSPVKLAGIFAKCLWLARGDKFYQKCTPLFLKNVCGSSGEQQSFSKVLVARARSILVRPVAFKIAEIMTRHARNPHGKHFSFFGVAVGAVPCISRKREAVELQQ